MKPVRLLALLLPLSLASTAIAEAVELNAGTAEVSLHMGTTVGGGVYGSPRIGYFVTDHIELAGALAYASYETTDDGGSMDTTRTAISLDALYNHPLDSLVFFGGAGLVWLSDDRESSDYSSHTTEILGWRLVAGARFFPVDNFSLNLELDYSYSDTHYDWRSHDEDDSESKGYGIQTGLSVFIR